MKKIIILLILISSLFVGCSSSKEDVLNENTNTINYEEYNKSKEYSENDGIILNGSVEKVYISTGETEGNFRIDGDITSIYIKYERKNFPNLQKSFELGGNAEFRCVKKYGDWYLSEVNNFKDFELDAGKYTKIRAELEVEGGGISKEDAIKLDSYCKEYEPAMIVERALENNIYELYPELNN